MVKKHFDFFLQNIILDGFLTKFSSSHKNATFLLFYRLFLFCPFDKNMWGCTCQISHYVNAPVLRYVFLKVRSEFCSHPVTLSHAVFLSNSSSCVILERPIWGMIRKSMKFYAFTPNFKCLSSSILEIWVFLWFPFKKCEQNSDQFLLFSRGQVIRGVYMGQKQFLVVATSRMGIRKVHIITSHTKKIFRARKFGKECCKMLKNAVKLAFLPFFLCISC